MSNLSGSGTLRGSLSRGGGTPSDVYWDDILDKPEFAAVATSGSYNDLTDKPTPPTVMVGATAQSNGAAGYAPQPLAGDQNKFLNGAGEWVTPQSSGVNYSTDEQIIGKWIDGTNLYRKVYTGLDFTPIYNTWSNIITNLPQNFKNLIKVDLMINTGSNGYNDLTASGLEVTYSILDNAIRIESNQSTNIRPINIFAIIYTKTTDALGG